MNTDIDLVENNIIKHIKLNIESERKDSIILDANNVCPDGFSLKLYFKILRSLHNRKIINVIDFAPSNWNRYVLVGKGKNFQNYYSSTETGDNKKQFISVSPDIIDVVLSNINGIYKKDDETKIYNVSGDRFQLVRSLVLSSKPLRIRDIIEKIKEYNELDGKKTQKQKSEKNKDIITSNAIKKINKNFREKVDNTEDFIVESRTSGFRINKHYNVEYITETSG
ncbi:MAG: hypothetical protein WCX97_01555 [Candidatus Magasanikbacteria bacterium]|jgi:hypothetical protein